MAPIARRTAAPAAPEGVNFLDMGMYSQGGGMPEGDYALEFAIQMFQAQNAQGVSRGPARLGVMITAHSLTDPSAEPRSQFYSMGSNADKSFAPHPETGKSLVPVPGGPATTLNNQTNWAIFLKSLFDSGLPQGMFTNDLSPLDGIHVHLSNIPEPEERKGFQSKTGEVQEERKQGTIAVVTEIKEDGMPWEGGGGIPDATAAAPAKAAPKAAVKPLVKPGVKAAPVAAKPAAVRTKPAPAPVEEEPAEAADDDVAAAATNAVTEVLEKNPNGCAKLLMRTGTFKSAVTAVGNDMAQAIIDTYFGSDENLNVILEPLGYRVAGAQIKLIE